MITPEMALQNQKNRDDRIDVDTPVQWMKDLYGCS
jgi:hypothetical protein